MKKFPAFHDVDSRFVLQIQKGLLQVGKGLQFLNHDAKVVHRNLVPEAIFVNAKVRRKMKHVAGYFNELLKCNHTTG
jgi:hypothetical protein